MSDCFITTFIIAYMEMKFPIIHHTHTSSPPKVCKNTYSVINNASLLFTYSRRFFLIFLQKQNCGKICIKIQKGVILIVKKGLISGMLFLLIVLIITYFIGEWKYVYYVCGGAASINIFLALAYFLDSLILGNKGTMSSRRKKCKIGRVEESKRFISIAIPNILAVLVYLVV